MEIVRLHEKHSRNKNAFQKDAQRLLIDHMLVGGVLPSGQRGTSFWRREGSSLGWGCFLPKGSASFPEGGSFLGGLLPGGGIPACTEADPLLTESQTRVKTQPWPQLHCGW